MKSVEHLVIGAGAMGLATAWQLASQGREVTVLEQFELENAQGSSHGGSRIFRVSYRDPLYTNLALSSIELWRDLELQTDSVLLEQIGQIDHGKSEALEDVKASLSRHGLAFESVSPKEAQSRWPGMEFDNEVVFSPDGGRANAASTLKSLIKRTAQLGGLILDQTKAMSIRIEKDYVIVETSVETFKTNSLIVSAGGWVTKLLGGLISLPKVTVDIGQPAHYQPIAELSDAKFWPSFIHHGDERRVETNLAFSSYGLFTPSEGMKIGTWANTPPVDPDNRDFKIDETLLARQNEYVAKWFPGLVTSSAIPSSCLFTNTPDEHFVLDRRGPITVCSPCSGHGFKFVPIIGKITAQLATGSEQTVSQWKLPS